MELCHQLLFAAEHGDMMTLSKLHQLGFSLDFTDYDYRSAAHVAAANGQVKVLKYLSKKGANMQVQDRWGILPMDDAKRKGHFKAAALIQDMVRDDDDDGLSDAGSVLTTSSRLSLNSRGGKSERAACPVAAKMGFQSSAFDCIDEGEEDESDAEGSKCTADGLRSLMSECRSD
jgi:ankyrin repeat protein